MSGAPPREPAAPPTWVVWGACTLVVSVLLVHVAYYFPFLSDDALISMRYAVRLAGGHGLTFSAGERVEGYTDLLWVLLLAGGRVLGLEPILLSRVLGLGAVVTGAIAIVLDGHRRGVLLAATLTALVYAASAPLAVWAIGGLEHGFMAGLYVLALIDLLRQLRSPAASRQPATRRAALVLAVLTLCRADALALTVPVAVGYAWALGRGKRASVRAAKLLAPSAIAYAGALAFRLAYYAELVPNTAVAKVAIGWPRLTQGLMHVAHAGIAASVLLVLALLGALVTTAPVRRLLLTSTVCWSAYVALVGGDIFPAWRQLVLAYPPLILLSASGIEWALARLRVPVAMRGVLGLLLAGAHFGVQHRDSENERAKQERWEHDGEPVARMLATAFGDRDPLLAVDAAGALPYFSRLRTLDMLGLTDRHIAHTRPPDFGHGGIGHELGDGAYVMRRRPDLIVFCGTRGNPQPCFRGGQQMWAMPAFHLAYRPTRFAPPHAGFEALVFVRRLDGPLGIQRNDGHIDVPGWLFSDSGRTRVELAASGSACMAVRPREPARFEGLWLKPGHWRMVLDADGPPIAAALRCAAPTRVDALKLASQASFSLTENASVSITVSTPDAAGACLRGLRIERADTASKRLDCAALSTRRLHRTWREVQGPLVDGDEWASASHTVFGKAGLRVEGWPANAPKRIALTLDANDTYALRLGAGERVLHRTRIEPTPGASGVLAHTIVLPDAVASQVQWLDIDPLQGDERYSLGHVHAVDAGP